MTCPRPDGTYADSCTNIPSTTSTSTLVTTTSTLPPVTSSTTQPVVIEDDCTIPGHTPCVATTVPVPAPELPNTGAGTDVLAAVGFAAVLIGARLLYRPKRRTV